MGLEVWERIREGGAGEGARPRAQPHLPSASVILRRNTPVRRGREGGGEGE